jgi:hypothetical protein
MKQYTAYAEAAIKASWKVFHCEREIDKEARAEYERTSYDELRARRFALKQDLRLKQAASDAAVADMLKLHRLCDAIKSKLANAMDPGSMQPDSLQPDTMQPPAAACCSLLPQADSILPEASEAAANLTIAAARADDAHAATAAAAAALKHIDDEKSDVDDELKRMDAAIAKATTDAVMAAAAVMARVGKRKLDLEASLEKMKR